MKKISTTIVAFLFAFCIFGVQANAASASEQMLEHLSVESSVAGDWQDSIVLSSDSLKLFESDFGVDYWDLTYELDKISPQIVSSIWADSEKFNYDVAVTDNNVHVRFKRAETPEADVDSVSASNSLSDLNHWNYMKFTGLDKKNYGEIVESIKLDGFIQLSEIVMDDNGETFSVLAETTTYLVCDGDTLSEIAVKKLSTVDELLRLNPQITDPNLIYVNDLLKIR